jgi:DNA-binding transcriptional MerR regulator
VDDGTRTPGRLTIGEFSVMTRLSKKALRHYHELGLLEPAQTDLHTGYRHYDTTQVQRAQVIRRLRGLGMPVPDVKAVLVARDVTTRSAVIAAHLERMEAQLAATQEAVGALRELLSPATARPIEVEFRSTPATLVAAITETVPLEGISAWFSAAVSEITAAAGSLACGPPGGLYAAELFSDELGETTVFVPVRSTIDPAGRVRPLVLPPGEWAVAVHHGPHTTIDRSYGELGSYVSERLLGADGPVRENYRPDRPGEPGTTEICWPVLRTSPEPPA